MAITHAFEKAFRRMEEKGWERIYVLVDLHDTVFKATYSEVEKYEWFPFAEDALRIMTANPKIALVLWSSTHQEKLSEYLAFFEEHNIHFDMVNFNHEVANTELSCFDHKTYFNVGIDDKFGFEAEKDWEKITNFLKK